MPTPSADIPLPKGANRPLTTAPVQVAVSPAGPQIDVFAALVGVDGRVLDDARLVFFNNPVSPDGSARVDGHDLTLDLPRVPADVARVVVMVALDEDAGVRLADVAPTAVLRQGGESVVVRGEGFTTERAAILLEVYRRETAWKVRAVSQGWAEGLPALLTQLGIDVAEDANDPRGSAPASSAALPAPALPAQSPAVGPVPLPTGLSPRPRSGGLFGRRKAAETEAARLRDLLAESGLVEREAVLAQVTALQQQVGELNATLERDRERARRQLEKELNDLNSQVIQVRNELAAAKSELVQVRDDLVLQEAGVYQYRHRLADAVAYRSALATLTDEIKTMARAETAVTGAKDWTVDGSVAKGRKMVRDFSKLMLRAYNAEADVCVRNLKPHTLSSAIDRLAKSKATIARLGGTMHIQVSEDYHRLRVRELELTADYLVKVEEEKERIRAQREREREEAAAQAEFRREQARLEREAQHYTNAIEAMRTKGDTAGAQTAETKLQEIERAIKGVEERAANIRTGYVYVISNVGAFGPNMVKIGLTRRLDPMDRVIELGGASVPFRFDVHALIFDADAVTLETKLHQQLAHRKVNLINGRREFFYITPGEVRDLLTQMGANVLRFTEEPEAVEWRQSVAQRKG